jgi:hypothetical protein
MLYNICAAVYNYDDTVDELNIAYFNLGRGGYEVSFNQKE